VRAGDRRPRGARDARDRASSLREQHQEAAPVRILRRVRENPRPGGLPVLEATDRFGYEHDWNGVERGRYERVESMSVERFHTAAELPRAAAGSDRMSARRRLRVLLLTHEELYARASTRGQSEREVLGWRTEYHVMRGLRRLGHEVEQLGLDRSLAPLHAALERFDPHVVFNLLIELRDSGGFEPHVVAALEASGARYTGCNSEGLVLTRDKALTKKLLGWHRIPAPAFATFRRGRPRAAAAIARLGFPLIVKPIDEGGSYGITQRSVVHGPAALERAVAWVQRRCECDAIAERYVAGREITVGLLGNRRPRALPLWETFFDGLTATAPRISTERLKWSPAHRRARAVHSGPARRLPPGTAGALVRHARRAWHVLRLSGFARIDFRVDADGRPWLIDVNANPDVDFREDFARAARRDGLPPTALLQRLLDLGLRYRPHWLG
jgi:D-alanine-D-alanine ligase